jgi:hypothetical protein
MLPGDAEAEIWRSRVNSEGEVQGLIWLKIHPQAHHVQLFHKSLRRDGERCTLAKRNAPYYCGSGKRFKHCHGRHQLDPEAHLQHRGGAGDSSLPGQRH